MAQQIKDILLWPNFVGSLLAPTTAKYGAVKKALAAASVAIFSIHFRFQKSCSKHNCSCRLSPQAE